MTDSVDRAVRALAGASGVVIDWVDAWGMPTTVAVPDVLRVVSAVIGTPLETERDVTSATAELMGAERLVEPVLVAWDGNLPVIGPDPRFDGATIVLESGEELLATVVEGRVVFSGELPIGYHQLRINGEASSHVLAAPKMAYPPPHGAIGIMGPTYSLRMRSHDSGLGGIAELGELADLASASQWDVVGTLPLLAAFRDQPSPYSPASRRAWNEVFIDLGAMPGWDRPSRGHVEPSSWVDYTMSGDLVRSELESYARYVSQNQQLLDRLDHFIDENPEMARYADFRARADVLGRNWRRWPQRATADPGRSMYHRVGQWMSHEQLSRLGSTMNARGQYLYLDLPVGCHPDGYDVWDEPSLFAPAAIGAPPDTLFAGGQNWGLPAPIPSVSRQTGHANFRKAVAKQMSVAGLLRIDHVMGIRRSWWVPHGLDAKRGAYVMQPDDELFAIICIESTRASVGVVGENLGTVPPEIDAGLTEHGLLGIVVMQDASKEPGPEDLVTLSSHDTPPFAAWWEGRDIEDHLQLGVFDETRADVERTVRADAVAALRSRFGTEMFSDTRDALFAWLAASPAAIALLSLDDLVSEKRRQNVPGTDTERPNWQLRYEGTIDDLADDVIFQHLMHGLSAHRSRSHHRHDGDRPGH